MKALIIVDVQNDFCEGGSLEVKNSNSIFPFINQLLKDQEFGKIFITKDWHPIDHYSFAANHQKNAFEVIEDLNGQQQILWPVHCAQHTKGAELSDLLDLSGVNYYEIRKGYLKHEECYSGFGTNENPTKLLKMLKRYGVEQVTVVGLALDFCVGSTALDAAKCGFKVTVIQQATKAVGQETAKQMIARMKSNGINYVSFKQYSDQTEGTSDGSINSN